MPSNDSQLLANAVRVLSIDAVEQRVRDIPGCRWAWPMCERSCLEELLKFDPADPAWPDRDRYVLSASYGSMLIYSLLLSSSKASVRKLVPGMTRHKQLRK